MTRTEVARARTEPYPTPDHGARLPYLPALDGLRAISVLAVLGYHAGFSSMPGGFFGVEVFFVISGYLITSLLLAERRDTGRIDFKAFWLRRARRLLPALFALLAVTTTVFVVFYREEVANLRGDVVAALTYTTNWYQIVADKSYFADALRPSPLRHLWSLAIEEQFYVFWPMIFGAGMFWLGRRNFLRAILVAVVCSTALMWLLYAPGRDPSRVYYGLDTRASGLLIGAALAFVWSPWRLRGRTGRGASQVLDVAGFVALFLLVRTFLTAEDFRDSVYEGGFARVSLISAVLIGVAVHPASRALKWLLSLSALRWIGLRSYGIYLWHFPIFMITRPGIDVPWSGWSVQVLRFALTFVVAELSYKYVEMPVRRGALGRAYAEFRAANRDHRRRLSVRWAGTSAAVVGATLLVGAAVAGAESPAPQLESFSNVTVPPSDAPTDAISPTAPDATAPDATAPDATAPDATAAPGEAPPETTAAAPTSAAPAPVTRFVALGDSVMLGAVDELSQTFEGNIGVDAAVSRQVGTGVEMVRLWQAAGALPDVLIVHLGNNGVFTDEHFDALMTYAGDRPVYFVNVRVPRRWQDGNNDVLNRGVARYENAHMVDWKIHGDAHPEFFARDTYHLNDTGAAFYAQLLHEAIAREL